MSAIKKKASSGKPSKSDKPSKSSKPAKSGKPSKSDSASAQTAADREELLATLEQVAREVRERAHAPYSGYKVGAAVVTADGTVFGGCNVENASFGATICAERSAILQMVSAGGNSPVACFIVASGQEPAPPCGMCRQVLREFAPDMIIISASAKDAKRRVEWSLADLLPGAFDGEFLARNRGQ
jgi:cytidine deaminase